MHGPSNDIHFFACLNPTWDLIHGVVPNVGNNRLQMMMRALADPISKRSTGCTQNYWWF